MDLREDHVSACNLFVESQAQKFAGSQRRRPDHESHKSNSKGLTLLLVVVTPLFCTVVHASAQWMLVWSDEFAGPAGSAPSDAKWIYESGNHNGWNNNEKEFTVSPVYPDKPTVTFKTRTSSWTARETWSLRHEKNRPTARGPLAV